MTPHDTYPVQLTFAADAHPVRRYRPETGAKLPHVPLTPVSPTLLAPAHTGVQGWIAPMLFGLGLLCIATLLLALTALMP